MAIQLTDVEARILGALVEKSLTTPDQYPLSLNSLTNACNQKTSRDPVMSLDETTVARALSTLREKNLTSPRSEPGSRVTKFSHRIENLIGGGNSKEVAICCVLLLRGPQTPGEIRIRTDRMAEFTSTQEVEAILQDMGSRPEPLAVRLPRQPGQKEARYQHLFCGAVHIPAEPVPSFPSSPAVSGGGSPTETLGDDARKPMRQLADLIGGRLMTLEQRVAYLEARVSQLENKPTY